MLNRTPSTGSPSRWDHPGPKKGLSLGAIIVVVVMVVAGLIITAAAIILAITNGGTP